MGPEHMTNDFNEVKSIERNDRFRENIESERPLETELPEIESSEGKTLKFDELDHGDSERLEEELPGLESGDTGTLEIAGQNPENNSIKLEKETKELTAEQKKEIKEKTSWSDEIIDSIGSVEEAEIYMNAGLVEGEVNGKKCLIRNDIDLDQKDEDGITNRERMERGRPPITKNGEEVELHHIGQKPDSPLAELTMEEHRGAGNDTILHDKTKETEIDRNEFGKERREHWKDRVNVMEGAE